MPIEPPHEAPPDSGILEFYVDTAPVSVNRSVCAPPINRKLLERAYRWPQDLRFGLDASAALGTEVHPCCRFGQGPRCLCGSLLSEPRRGAEHHMRRVVWN